MSKEPIAFVLAGGEGKRLYPLTKDRAKPAVTFGGCYRIIDFTLSNLYNSKIRNIYWIPQYNYTSLYRHIKEGWIPRFGIGSDEFLEVVPPMKGYEFGWSLGTAHAISQNRRFIERHDTDLINITGGDHIYLMDYRQFNDYHRKKESDFTIAAIAVDKKIASEFGILKVNENWELIDFKEKPEDPTPIPNNLDKCLVSMGIYATKKSTLLEELTIDTNKKTADGNEVYLNPEELSSHDFGNDIIPSMLRNKNRKVCVYNFEGNLIEGASEEQKGYWKDIGNLEQFLLANLEVASRSPRINLYNQNWPVLSNTSLNPRRIPTRPVKILELELILGNGTTIETLDIHRSVLCHNVKVKDSSSIEGSVLLGSIEVGRNVRIKNAIVDKAVDIPDGETIGYDLEKDIERGFVPKETPHRIPVVPKRYKF